MCYTCCSVCSDHFCSGAGVYEGNFHKQWSSIVVWQVARVQKMLGDEFGTASNIKSRVNRQSVLGAITSAQQRLKLYNKVMHAFDVPLRLFTVTLQRRQHKFVLLLHYLTVHVLEADMRSQSMHAKMYLSLRSLQMGWWCTLVQS